MDELLQEFVTQTREHLDKLEADLVALEREPGARVLLERVFRTLHSIKGTSGFLGLPRLQGLAHAGEHLLARARDGALALDATRIEILLRLSDTARRMLANIESVGSEGDEDPQALVEELRRFQDPAAVADAAAATAPVVNAAATPIPPPATTPAAPAAAPAAPPPASVPATPSTETGRPAERTETSGAEERSIRVNVDLLDRLMNLVGELVLARNQVLQVGRGNENSGLASAAHTLDRITTELQETVMRTRLQPIRNVLGKVPRMARDLAASCDKLVRVDTSGEDTELDKSLLEAIRDPIGHLVRNCIDHGIEMPEARRALGKPEEGRLHVRAYHEGGQVHLQIGDDGRGMDPELLRQSAIALGMMGPAEAARLGDAEALELIFRPGFSTAHEVTSVSGRGVGMDVVRTDLERIGGTVSVTSTPGIGTAFHIKIPLTMAILPALVVTCGTEQYALPRASLLELVRMAPERVRREVEWIDDQAMVRLRGRLLPLVFLARVLDPGQRAPRLRDGDIDALHILVLQTENRAFGLVVDQVHDMAEIVVKPLGKRLEDLRVFAGATILGDGRVALILDVAGVAQQAGIVARSPQRSDEASPVQRPAAARESLLLVESGGERLALPLDSVSRLEELPSACVESVGGRLVARYHGEVLHLLAASEFVGKAGCSVPDSSETFRTVVVVGLDGTRGGLVVDRILDAVPAGVRVEGAAPRPGVVARTVLQDRVTDVLDVQAFLRLVAPAGGGEPGGVVGPAWAVIAGGG